MIQVSGFLWNPEGRGEAKHAELWASPLHFSYSSSTFSGLYFGVRNEATRGTAGEKMFEKQCLDA